MLPTKDISVYQPWIAASDIAAIAEALELGWLGMGSYVGEFEQAIRTTIGARDQHVVAVSTGHAALHLAMYLVDAGPGTEVITPSFNNIADLQAIAAVGADPVFADIHDETLCIDLDRAEALIGPKTKAIIVMDYACHLCDHDRVRKIAESYGIRIIHDAAHAFGSCYRGAPIGSFSDIAIFSFDPVKTVTTIDGGALVVRTEEERERLHEMRLIGMKQAATVMYGNQRAWNYDVERLGFRYHLSNPHAALGLAQLSRFQHIVKTRRRAYTAYADQLKGIAGLRLPVQDVSEIVPFMFYVRIIDGRREEFRQYLQERGVDTGIHWQPAHWFTMFRDCRKGDLSVTDRVGKEIVSLPFHSNMNAATQTRVIEMVRSYFAGKSSTCVSWRGAAHDYDH
jgi:dTDP-4-amino-4,6-dideoxygalactose transaminase